MEESEELPSKTHTVRGGSFDFKNVASFATERVTTYHKLLSSSDPVTSSFWWCFKHPITRIFTCLFVLLTNFYVYWGDPASFSQAKSYGTLIGDIYHGFMQPDDPPWLAARYFMMFLLMIFGTWVGLLLQQKVLRDYLRLTLFGYDNGRNPNRHPLADQDGAFLTVGACICGSWFLGLKVYAGILTVLGAANKHIPDSGMHNWSFAGYNLALAGVLTFIGDWWNIGAVIDQMLQSVQSNDGDGFLAYAALGASAETSNCQSGRARLRWWANWWAPRRLYLTRVFLLLGWPPVLYGMFWYFGVIMRALEPPPEDRVAGVELGRMWAWTAEWNTEFVRMLAGSLVAFGNLCIVAQDWDFPNFSESKDLAIMTVQLSSFTIPIPDWLRIGAEKRLPVWSGMSVGSGLYISGKWFNYFGILWGVAFDWAYWFMTALCFRTCDYAQFWESSTGRIFSMTDFDLQQHHAGAASATDCPWFTDNPLIENWYHRNSTDDVFVVLVGTGSFTGAYTINEQNAYVFNGNGAEFMWLMCIPPLVGWFGLAWIICTHERVTCFNYKKLLDWAALHHLDDDDDSSIGDWADPRNQRRSLEMAAEKLGSKEMESDREVSEAAEGSGTAAHNTVGFQGLDENSAGKQTDDLESHKPATPRHGKKHQKFDLPSQPPPATHSAGRGRRGNSLERQLSRARRYEAKSFRNNPSGLASAAASRRASAKASRAASRAASRPVSRSVSREGSPAPPVGRKQLGTSSSTLTQDHYSVAAYEALGQIDDDRPDDIPEAGPAPESEP